MNALRRLARGIDAISEAVGRAAAWLVVAMVVLGALNALLRWAGKLVGRSLGSNALLEGQWYLFALVFLLGAAATLRQGRHVRVDVLYGRLSPRGQAAVDLAGTLLFLLPFCAFALITSWPSVAASWAVREVSPDPGGLPRWPIKAVVLVAFGLLALQGVAFAIGRILVLAGVSGPDDDTPSAAPPASAQGAA